MNRLPGLAVTLVALILGCASPGRQISVPPAQAASMDGVQTPAAHMHMPELTPGEAARRYRMQVTSEEPLRARIENQVDVFLLGSDQQPVTDLMVHHERLAHFLVVSENLDDFHHLHAEDFDLLTPEARQAGRFGLRLTPASGGRYLLAMDFVAGMRAAHLSRALEVAGPDQPRPRWDFSRQRQSGSVRLLMATRPDPVVAGSPVVGTLALTSPDGEPLLGLQPYLGARAHLAVFREGLTGSAHLHGAGDEAAPYTSSPATTGTRIHFEHRFTNPGRYRLFVQFQQGEILHTVPLDLQVEEPRVTN